MKRLLIALIVGLLPMSALAQIGQSFEKFTRLKEYEETAPQGNKHFFHSADNSAQVTVWLTADNTIRKIEYEFDLIGSEYKDDTLQTLCNINALGGMWKEVAIDRERPQYLLYTSFDDKNRALAKRTQRDAGHCTRIIFELIK